MYTDIIMKIAIHQANYLPYLGFFHKLANCDLFLIYDTAQFVKGEYHNRNTIKWANWTILLTLPVKKESHFLALQHTHFDSSILKKHWMMISQSYAKAPFFKDYKQQFECLYNTYEWNNLNEFNTELIRAIATAFDIHTPIHYVSDYVAASEERSTDALITICKQSGADAYLSGAWAKSYLDAWKFEEAHIALEYQSFHHPIYEQLWWTFVPYMCSLDLLFNVWPNSKAVLLAST